MSDECDTQPSEPIQPPTPHSMSQPRAAAGHADVTPPMLSRVDADETLSRNSKTAATPNADATEALLSEPVLDAALPEAIGPYRIMGLLGVGGMGAVYEVQQARPNRTVALKVIKPGFVSPSLLKRFEREADVLGRLQHPGIAQVYEAGTAPPKGGGPEVPFFAMELVRGTTLTRFAEEKKLDLRRRLELVTRICDAVKGGAAPLTLRGHSDAISCVALSADSKRLVSAGASNDKSIRVCDAGHGN